jgi:hypothetical protein
VSAQEEGGTVIIPDGEKIIYKSELFDVIVRGKHKSKGIVRDRYLVAVELLEHDPLLERTALLDIPEDVWKQLTIGERAKARLYELPDKTWSTKPPAGVP